MSDVMKALAINPFANLRLGELETDALVSSDGLIVARRIEDPHDTRDSYVKIYTGMWAGGFEQFTQAMLALATLRAALTPPADECHCPEHGSWVSKNDQDRLVRELDVLLNGEHGAAKQASLCDIVSQVRREKLSLRAAPPADDEVKAIRARHEYMQDVYGDEAICPRGQRDRATLLALVDRLSAELAKERERWVEASQVNLPVQIVSLSGQVDLPIEAFSQFRDDTEEPGQ